MTIKAAFFAPPKAIELVAAESPILVFVQQIEQRALRRRRLKVHCELFEMSLHVLNDPWVSRNRAQQLLQQAVEAVLLMVAVDDVCNYKVEHDNNHCEQTHTNTHAVPCACVCDEGDVSLRMVGGPEPVMANDFLHKKMATQKRPKKR